MSFFALRKRNERIDGRIAKLRRSYGRDRSTWPTHALIRLERLNEQRRHLAKLCGDNCEKRVISRSRLVSTASSPQFPVGLKT